MRTVMAMACLLLTLAVAGCAAPRTPSNDDVDDLRNALAEEGYSVSTFSYSSIDHLMSLSATLDPDKPELAETSNRRAGERIAEIVWTTFPGEIDEVEIEITSADQVTLNANALTGKFGERPSELVERDRTGAWVALVLVIVLVAGLIGLVWWFTRKRKSAGSTESDRGQEG